MGLSIQVIMIKANQLYENVRGFLQMDASLNT